MARSGPIGQINQEPCLKRFRPRLSQAMREAGIDVNELAARTDMSRGAFTMYLNGCRIPYGVCLVRLARELHVSTDWLLGISDDPTPR